MEANQAEVARRPRSLQLYIVGVDFDGTITTTNEFPRIGKLRPGIKELLLRIKAAGHEVVLTTCRSGSYLTDAIRFLEKNELRCVFSGYNVQSRYAPQGLSAKVYAHFLLDDSATPGAFDVRAWVEYFEKLGVIPRPSPKPGKPSNNRRK